MSAFVEALRNTHFEQQASNSEIQTLHPIDHDLSTLNPEPKKVLQQKLDPEPFTP